jgi:hypothetical protein
MLIDGLGISFGLVMSRKDRWLLLHGIKFVSLRMKVVSVLDPSKVLTKLVSSVWLGSIPLLINIGLFFLELDLWGIKVTFLIISILPFGLPSKLIYTLFMTTRNGKYGMLIRLTFGLIAGLLSLWWTISILTLLLLLKPRLNILG